MSDNKKKLQNEELKILKYIVNVLEKNKLRYFMQGGTFLGAIRHKGFIPWDDDIDIGLPRNDYMRFISLMRNEKNPEYEIITFEDEKSECNFMCKVHSKKIIVKEKNYNNNKEYGIWVDIFPLDGMPNNRIIREIHKFRLLFHRATWKLSDNGDNIAQNSSRKSMLDKIIIFFGVKLKICKLFNKKKEIQLIDNLLQKYNYDNSKYVVNFMGAYKFREMFKRSVYDDCSYYQFEDIELPGPTNYDYYLKQMYGDYMTPPKTENREVHELEIRKEL